MQTAYIFIAGDFLAPRSRFIETISDLDPVSTELGDTSLYFGRLIVNDELVIYFFGNPDSRRFDKVWAVTREKLAQIRHLGTVLLVDTARHTWVKHPSGIMSTYIRTLKDLERYGDEGEVIEEWSGLREAPYLLRVLETADAPHIIAVTGQEQPASMPLADVQAALQPKDGTQMMVCDAADLQSAKTVLLALLRQHPQDDEMVQKVIAKVEML